MGNTRRASREDPDQVEVENLTKPAAAAILSAGKRRQLSAKKKSPLETSRRFVCRQCTLLIVATLTFATAFIYLCAESEEAVSKFGSFLNATHLLIRGLARLQQLQLNDVEALSDYDGRIQPNASTNL